MARRFTPLVYNIFHCCTHETPLENVCIYKIVDFELTCQKLIMHLALTVLLVVVVVVESGSDATPMEHYPTSVAGRCPMNSQLNSFSAPYV